jgi:hypothetical protein
MVKRVSNKLKQATHEKEKNLTMKGFDGNKPIFLRQHVDYATPWCTWLELKVTLHSSTLGLLWIGFCLCCTA